MPMTNARMYQMKVVEEPNASLVNASNISQLPSSHSQKLFGFNPSGHNLKGNSTMSADQKQNKKTQ
jgi:hypothetical protein